MPTKRQFFAGAVIIAFIVIVLLSKGGGLQGVLSGFSGIELFKSSGGEDNLISGYTELAIKPASFKLISDKPINLSIGSLKVANFNGVLGFDFEGGKVSIKDEKKELEAEAEIIDFILRGVHLKTIKLESTELALKTGKWDFSTKNGSVDISDFSGDVFVSLSGLELKGNATGKLKK